MNRYPEILIDRFLQPSSAKFLCALVLACMPPVMFGAAQVLLNPSQNVLDWLPQSFEETQRLFWFVERFGSDEILVIGWPDCTLDDERLDHLADALVQTPPANGLSRPLFRYVVTGRDVLDRLTSEPLNLPREVATQRMRGWLLGTNDVTCAMAWISPEGADNRPAALQYVHRVAEKCGIHAGDLRLGGPTADSVAIAQVSQRGIVGLGFASVFLSLALAWFCHRSLRWLLVLFGTAGFAWATSLASVYVTGATMDAVLFVMPALVFILAISGGVHLSNYYRDALQDAQPKQVSRVALQRGWLPCTLAAGTTALGLAALSGSQVVPIQRFSVYSSWGVVMTLLALLLLWPALATVVLAGNPRNKSTAQWPGCGWWMPLYRLSQRRAKLICLASALAVPVLIVGLARLQTSVQLSDLLSSRSKLLQDHFWLNEKIGPLVPLEIVLRFPNAEALDGRGLLARAEVTEHVRRLVVGHEDVGGAVAATTFAPTLPSGTGARQFMLRRSVAAHLRRHFSSLTEMGLVAEVGDEQLWRISARIRAIDIDYARLLAEIEQRTNEALDRYRHTRVTSAEICGGVPLVFTAQRQLLHDLSQSFLTAFLLIGLVMMWLMRGARAGLIAMVPNVFPALLAFGTMGWIGTPVDIGTMMTASIAMGIAVDDTVHFLVWFRRGLDRKQSRPEAIRFAFENCATAILQTSVICGLGIMPFFFSPFAPVSRFALIMAILLLLALLTDLLLLPSILSSRLGRLLEPGSRKRNPS